MANQNYLGTSYKKINSLWLLLIST